MIGVQGDMIAKRITHLDVLLQGNSIIMASQCPIFSTQHLAIFTVLPYKPMLLIPNYFTSLQPLTYIFKGKVTFATSLVLIDDIKIQKTALPRPHSAVFCTSSIWFTN